MICSKCGQQIDVQALFCPRCGQKIDRQQYPPVIEVIEKPSNKCLVITLIVVGTLALLGIIVAVCIIAGGLSSENKNERYNSPDYNDEYVGYEDDEVDEEPVTEAYEIAEEESETYTEDDYIFPSDTMLITTAYLDTLEKDEIALLRNEIYARHGYIFQTEEYRNYFNQKDWYYPNPNFSESDFNNIELQNKDTIIDYEKEKGWRS